MAEHYEYLVLDGKILPYQEAKLHILTPAVKYGATAFEGLRAYWNEDLQQLFVFRSSDHMSRLMQSGRLMGMESVDYTVEELNDLLCDLLIANKIREDVHIRPSLFVVGEGQVPARGPVSLGMAVIPMERWADKTYRLCISSWRRIDDNSLSPRIKCAANYQNGRMALIQAKEDGYDGCLMLDHRGHVTEEPRGCFFMVRKGVPVTSPLTDDILESITRETLIELFNEFHGIQTEVREIDRTELYVAEEVFLCGTGMEVTPVGQIDRFLVGNGQIGPLTTTIRQSYIGIARGVDGRHSEWRMPVYPGV